MRLFLKYRDGTCTFPGCTRPAESAELDHTHERQDGCGTDADNLAHLCRKHHALKSVALVQARQQAARAAFGTDSQYAEPTGTKILTTMLGYERTTTPSDRDRLLGIVCDPLAREAVSATNVPGTPIPASSGAAKPTSASTSTSAWTSMSGSAPNGHPRAVRCDDAQPPAQIDRPLPAGHEEELPPF